MFKSIKGARLGLFVFLGTVLLVVSIFVLGNKDQLFTDTISVKTYFTTIEGLKNGAPVWLSGYNIGSVKSISLANGETGKVEVSMKIKAELHHFIRLNSIASIETEGLVGKKIVSITPGTSDKAIVSDGGFIASRTPIKISEILEDSRDVIKHLNTLSAQFADISVKINNGTGTVGKLINDDSLYSNTVEILKSADKSIKGIQYWFNQIASFTDTLNQGLANITENVNSGVLELKSFVKDVKNGKGLLGHLVYNQATYDSVMAVVNNLIKTTVSTKLGAERLAENMEALKHNWLFKGYFENRGYWDSAKFDKKISKKLSELDKQKEIINSKLKELDELKSELQELKKK